jgi:hypothetical protein
MSVASEVDVREHIARNFAKCRSEVKSLILFEAENVMDYLIIKLHIIKEEIFS